MGINRIKQFVNIAKDGWLSEATTRALSFFWTKITKYLINQLDYTKPIEINKWSNILYIEASNNIDGWWLGDGIFKIPAIESLSKTSENTVDILTTKNRALIFQNNPNIKNIHIVKENWLDTLNYIQENWYTHIFTINPSWRMFFIMILTWDLNVIKKAYSIPSDIMLKQNHIDMYIESLQKLVNNLIISKNTPHIYLKTNNILPKWFFYIWINLGAKSALRNFKDWLNVFDNIKNPIPKNVKFILVGNKQIQDINTKLLSKLWESVIDCTTKLTLDETYNIISQCNAFIWTDWWNINAAIAILEKNIFPIYSVVPWEKRLPSNFPENDIIQWKCPMYETWCFEHKRWTSCNITGQSELDFSTSPPCISSSVIIENLVSKIEWLFKQAETLSKT